MKTKLLLAILLPVMLAALAATPDAASGAKAGGWGSLPPAIASPSHVILVHARLIVDVVHETPVITGLNIQPGSFNPLPAETGSLQPIGQYWVEAVDSKGATVIRYPFAFPRLITVPMAPEGAPPDDAPARIDIRDPEVALVLPYSSEIAEVRILSADQSLLNSMSMGRAPIPESVIGQEPLALPGPSDKFDLLIIASGYNAATMAAFNSRAQAIRASLLATEPFQSYSAKIVIQAFANTQDLGCFCGCAGIDRLLCCDQGAVVAAAASSGFGYDEILVVHNTATYCGSGVRDLGAFQDNSYSSYAVVYDGDWSEWMAKHEMGHSVADLCDEYTYGSEGFSYYDCVNCRATCSSWQHLTGSCTASCDARPSYYRPEDSVMLQVGNHVFNQASSQQGLLPRLLYFMGASAGTTAFFQDGVFPGASYAGTRDTYISQHNPTANFGAAATLNVDGQAPNGSGHPNWTLFKWDLTSILPGKTVQSAAITIDVTNHSSGQTYKLYELSGNWSEATVTWNSKPAWGATVLGAIGFNALGMQTVNLNAAGVAIVQKWIDNPATNFGFAIADGGNSDGFDFPAREEAVPTRRPKLTVVYSAGGQVAAIVDGPWLQNTSQTTMMVMWEVSKQATGAIRYRKQGSTTWTSKSATPVTVGGKWISTASLTALLAGTAYDYQVRPASGVAWTPTAVFATAPGATTNFLAGAYGDSRTNSAAHQQVTNALAARSPKLSLHVGDLVATGQCYADWKPQFFDPAKTLLAKSVFYPAPGNHEYLACTPAGRIWYYDFFNLPGNGVAGQAEKWYAFSYGCGRFISLDSYDANSESFSFSADQFNWLHNELDSTAYTSAKWQVVFLHLPLHMWPNTTLRNQVYDLFRLHGVDLVLEGHRHRYERGVKDGIPYVIVGGGGAPLDACASDPIPGRKKCVGAPDYSYATLEFVCGSSPALKLKAYKPDGALIDSYNRVVAATGAGEATLIAEIEDFEDPMAPMVMLPPSEVCSQQADSAAQEVAVASVAPNGFGLTLGAVEATAGAAVALPVYLTSGEGELAGLNFSLDFDPTRLSFDPTDADDDGLPDSIVFVLPEGFAAAVDCQPAAMDGELAITLTGLDPALLSDPTAPILWVAFNVADTDASATTAVGFAAEPTAIAVAPDGQKAPIATQEGLVSIHPTQAIYLPLMQQ